jgi:3-phenylpropionate/trans-cinnamate dioxygenase ferredoxin reductase subunit
MPALSDVLIVGAGQAGAQVAISLRQGGYSGSITLLGDETDLPYERPPLSKEYLAGDKTAERLLLRGAAYWQEHAVTLQLGETVVAVNPAAHSAETLGGRSIGYGKLVWAAGGKARALPLPGGNLDGVFTLRSRSDVDRLRAALDGFEHVAIIGAGYIGLEVAPGLRKFGKRVTVIESQERVLARVTSTAVSDFYAAEHRAHGVELLLGAGVAGLVERSGRAVAVAFLDGRAELACDAIIVAIGISPAVQALKEAGVKIGNGVEVDSYCQTSVPDIFAIGDCASHVNRYAGTERVRIESVQNAVDQAKVVAGVILGQPVPYSAVPWFWSNQYDIRLQTAGLSGGHDAHVVRGEPAGRSFSVVYLRAGRVIAIDCINCPRDFIQGKALVERGLSIDMLRLADPTRSLKSLAEEAA